MGQNEVYLIFGLDNQVCAGATCQKTNTEGGLVFPEK